LVKHALLAAGTGIFLVLDPESGKSQPTKRFEQVIICQKCWKVEAEIFQETGNFCSTCWMDYTYPEVDISSRSMRDEQEHQFLSKQ
jgi:protein-arginine kinase activator protein McsA